MKIGDVFWQARIDDKGLVPDAKKAGNKAGVVMAQSTKGSWSKELKTGIGLGAGLVAMNAVGMAIQGVTGFIDESIQAASDLDEAMSKSSVVFGRHADEMEEWAEGGAEAFGLSKRAALEAAGTYGNLFQAFGIGQDRAKEMSVTLVELAADLASFNNTSIEDALEALRSGLSGETEPLKRYGIALSDARMRQVLMEQGIKDLGATLTPLQKSQAAYTLILKDSTLAQGDFIRTSEGLANQQRITNAELENMQAEVGEEAIPLALEWEKAQLNLFRGINLVADAVNHENQSLERQIEVSAAGIRMNVLLSDSEKEKQLAILAASLEAVKAAKANEEVTTSVEGMRGAIFGASTTMDRGAKSAEEMTKELAEMEKAAAETEREIDDLASTIAEDLFGDAINAGNLASMQQTHRELLKQRDAAKVGSREYTILTGEIAENQQAMFDLQLQMKQKEGPRAVIAWLREQKRLFGDTTGAIQALIDKYLTLDQVQSTVSARSPFRPGAPTRRRARGGPVAADTPYLVGEEGPELWVPNQSGFIVPNSGTTASLAGTPSVSSTLSSSIGAVTVNVDARGLSNPGAVGAAVKQGVADAMADVLRGQTARLPVGTRA